MGSWGRRPEGRVRGRRADATLGLAYLLGLALGVLVDSIACRFEGYAPEEYILANIGVQVLLIATYAIDHLVLRRERAVLNAWTAGDGTDESLAREAHRVSLELPRRFVQLAIPFNVPVVAILGSTWTLWVGGSIPRADLLLLILGAGLGVTQWAVTSHFMIDLALRPIARESAIAAGELDMPVVAVPLATKLFAGVITSTLLSGLVVGSFLVPAGSGAAGLLRMFVIGGVAGGAVGLMAVVLILLTVLGPIREMTVATSAVSTGDLNARVVPVSSDELGLLAGSFNRMVRGLREREALYSAVGSYIDPAIAARVVDEGALIQGEAVEATVMFIDIVGFTSMAEGADPAAVVADLNAFFEIVIPIIERHGGHANKLLGDGLMAVFGVPKPLADHAKSAVAAAGEVARCLTAHYRGTLRAGIGLNSGFVVAGSMGGGGKLDYTIIGDVVNVAARVEATTRATGDAILITEETLRLADTDGADLVDRGSVHVKGRQAPVAVCALPIVNPPT